MTKRERKGQHEEKKKQKEDHEFSEELADGGERNEVIENQKNPLKGVRLI